MRQKMAGGHTKSTISGKPAPLCDARLGIALDTAGQMYDARAYSTDDALDPGAPKRQDVPIDAFSRGADGH
jgi:hypothetical protein